MLKTLIKKQLMEVFRSYFYNAKKNKTRSKSATIFYIVGFVLVMVVILGGMFAALSLALCYTLVEQNLSWLYFALMSLIAIFLGAFGSVFNTYAGLYLGKDNDLLLSMPIPVKFIIIARLLNVYLLGLMYSAVVSIPAVVVHLIIAGFSVKGLLSGILYIALISIIVLILSCLLGWCVAKVSQKFKGKSFVSVILSIVFIAVYYFVYFKASEFLQVFLANAQEYAEKIKGFAYGVYVFGKMGEGDLVGVLVSTAVVLAALVATWFILKKSFTAIAIASSTHTTATKKAKDQKEKSPLGALIAKEFKHFTSSATYMLNCGLASILLVVAGGALLIKGGDFAEVLGEVFGFDSGIGMAIMTAMICAIIAMNDIATPSISLEGKSLWILHSLPIKAKDVILAKMAVQYLASAVPALFASICAIIVVPMKALEIVFMILVPLVFTAFTTGIDMLIGIKKVNFHWTSEIVVIKQSFSVFLAMLVNIVPVVVLGLLYVLFGIWVGNVIFFALSCVLLAVLAAVTISWNLGKGAKRFAKL